MSGEVFYGRTVHKSEGSRTAKSIVGRRMADGQKFLLLFRTAQNEQVHPNHLQKWEGAIIVFVSTEEKGLQDNSSKIFWSHFLLSFKSHYPPFQLKMM